LVTLAFDFCEVWDDVLSDLEWICAMGALKADVGLVTVACFSWGEDARWLFWAAGALAGACFCWGDAALWAEEGLLTGAAVFCAVVGLTAAFCAAGLVTLAVNFCEVWDVALADLEWVCEGDFAAWSRYPVLDCLRAAFSSGVMITHWLAAFWEGRGFELCVTVEPAFFAAGLEALL
jgi:hypothetical protein